MAIKQLIDDPRISSVVFYPRKTSIPNDLPHEIKALNFQISEDILIGGYCYIKDSNLPTILFFHGNGEIALDYRYFYELFFECDINLAVADFRGYGHSTGQPIYSGLITDAMPIYIQFKEWMINNNLKNSLFVQGRSLGSVCASEIGSHNPKELNGVIFESGFASIYNMMTRLFGVRSPDITPANLSEYSNDTRIKKFQKPTLIIHGTMDWIIPCEEGKAIFNSIKEGIDKKLVLIEGAGHNDIFSYKEEYFTPLKGFIKKYK
ncbi:MAG: alpha/beta hydrolase [Candidatus Hodarchaeota archaeon]